MNDPTAAPVVEELSEFIENRTYEEIRVGDQAVLTRTLRPEDIQLFAIMSSSRARAPSTSARRSSSRVR